MSDARIVQGVIFDVDGTLVDSETLSAELLATILAEDGVQITRQEMLDRLRGKRFSEVADQLAHDFPAIEPASLTASYRSRTLPLFRERLQPMDGAIELVRGLKAKKCIASNGPRNKIETSLRAVGLLEDFEGYIVCAYEVGAWKPDPALVLYAARLMEVAPEHCLLVEDSLPGIGAGLAAGMRVFGYGDADFSSVQAEPGFTHISSLREAAQRIAALG